MIRNEKTIIITDNELIWVSVCKRYDSPFSLNNKFHKLITKTLLIKGSVQTSGNREF